MSHFTVLVVGENVEEQLAPYAESLEVDPYQKECYCVEEGVPKSDCKDCNGSGLYESTYNPKSKWDWYSVGGRWSGYFLLKEGASGTLGCPGVFHNEPRFQVDVAKKGDIDWEGMGASLRTEYEELWDKMQVDEDKSLSTHYWRYGLEEGDTKETYIARHSKPMSFFAVLKDGQWYEKGEMHFWAVVVNEKDEHDWNDEVKKLIEGIDNAVQLTVNGLSHLSRLTTLIVGGGIVLATLYFRFFQHWT